ncbi:hypothetical protein EAY27_21825, partial [Vibrio anguillarum]|uniref:hypothetical protein n=1 Tax=Vibrio anguillarum TaxID=55601 RepID=UPI001BE40A2C
REPDKKREAKASLFFMPVAFTSILEIIFVGELVKCISWLGKKVQTINLAISSTLEIQRHNIAV